MKRAGVLFAAAGLGLIAVFAVPGVSPGATGPNGETLTLEPACFDYPPWHGVTLTLTGFPPHSVVQGEIGLPGGGAAGYGPVQTDDNGSYSAYSSTDSPGTFTGSVEWSGGSLFESRYIDCARVRGSPEMKPPIVRFGEQEIGYFSAPKNVTVTNRGPGPLIIRRVRLAGRHPEEFLIAADACSGQKVASGNKCFLRVRFGPQADGSRGARLEMATSVRSDPYPIALHGTGFTRPHPEGNHPISARVEPTSVAGATRQCFAFSAREGSAPLTRALVRFAGEQTRTDAEGKSTICKVFAYPGTRTARVSKRGYRSALLRIHVSAATGTSAVAVDPGGESLRLRADCSQYPPSHIVRIYLAGFAPHTQVTGGVDLPGGGGAGPVTVETDGNGRYFTYFGSSVPGRFAVRIHWSGGRLAAALNVDCSQPG